MFYVMIGPDIVAGKIVIIAREIFYSSVLTLMKIPFSRFEDIHKLGPSYIRGFLDKKLFKTEISS